MLFFGQEINKLIVRVRRVIQIVGELEGSEQTGDEGQGDSVFGEHPLINAKTLAAHDGLAARGPSRRSSSPQPVWLSG